MTTLKSSLQQYILNAILVTVAVIIVVIAVYMIYLFRRVIKPINTIAAEAEALPAMTTEYRRLYRE